MCENSERKPFVFDPHQKLCGVCKFPLDKQAGLYGILDLPGQETDLLTHEQCGNVLYEYRAYIAQVVMDNLREEGFDI